MKRYLPIVIIIGVAAITLAAATWLYRAHRPAPLSLQTDSAQADAAGAGHERGGKAPLVTIEEYGDFQCPSCAGFAHNLHKLEANYGDKMRVIFHQFPLAMHPNARAAAIASEAAALQGKFWPMFDLLYLQQKSWSQATDPQPLFGNFAAMLQLNVARFQRDLHEDEARKRVEADEAKGKAAGVTSTPTVFVNGTQVPSSDLNPEGFGRIVAAAVNPPAKH